MCDCRTGGIRTAASECLLLGHSSPFSGDSGPSEVLIDPEIDSSTTFSAQSILAKGLTYCWTNGGGIGIILDQIAAKYAKPFAHLRRFASGSSQEASIPPGRLCG